MMFLAAFDLNMLKQNISNALTILTDLNMMALLPMLILLGAGIIVLLGDAFSPSWRQTRWLNPGVSLIGIGIAALTSLQMLTNETVSLAFNNALAPDTFSQACNLILLLSAALAVMMATTYLENRRLNLAEYYVLVLFATAGAMLMAASNDLIVLFIAIETLSVALYVLAGFARTEPRSEEAALKYFLLGAFAAGFLLYGIALIYGGSAGPRHPGTTQLEELSNYMRYTNFTPSVMLMTGVALLLVGLGFKAALVPFHMWTPDVYEGAPTSVTAFMAASVKIGAFAAILRVFNALTTISPYWLIAIQVLAVLTMFSGNILAVTQDNVKRMLAYSSIAHAGYLLVAVAAATVTIPNLKADPLEAIHKAAFSAAMFYLLAYTLMTMGAFAILILLSRRGRDVQTLNDLKGLARTDPLAAYTMLIFMLSLGGIPPTMGFTGKWLIFNAALGAGQTGLAIALALASVISIYYYLKVVWIMCFQEPEGDVAPERAAPLGVRLSVLVTGIGSLALGIMPGLTNMLMDAATKVVRP
jgi:NADH-quinone oxidoreductase subunit N